MGHPRATRRRTCVGRSCPRSRRLRIRSASSRSRSVWCTRRGPSLRSARTRRVWCTGTSTCLWNTRTRRVRDESGRVWCPRCRSCTRSLRFWCTGSLTRSRFWRLRWIRYPRGCSRPRWFRYAGCGAGCWRLRRLRCQPCCCSCIHSVWIWCPRCRSRPSRWFCGLRYPRSCSGSRCIRRAGCWRLRRLRCQPCSCSRSVRFWCGPCCCSGSLSVRFWCPRCRSRPCRRWFCGLRSCRSARRGVLSVCLSAARVRCRPCCRPAPRCGPTGPDVLDISGDCSLSGSRSGRKAGHGRESAGVSRPRFWHCAAVLSRSPPLLPVHSRPV